MSKKITLHHVVLLWFCLLACSVLQAQTIRYVKPVASGNGSGSSWANASADLQAMINASSSGQQIWVAAGTYRPNRRADATATITANNRYNAFVLKSGVKIYGNFAGTENLLSQRVLSNTANASILSGDFSSNDSETSFGSHSENAYHVVVSAGAVTTAELNGFTIRGGNANGSTSTTISVNSQPVSIGYGGGMYCATSSPILTNLKVLRNQGTYGGGFFFISSLPALTSSIIMGNNGTNRGGGIYNDTASANTFTNLVIAGNTSASSGGGGIYCNNAPVTLSHVTVSANNSTSAHAMRLVGSNTTIRNSIIYGNSTSTVIAGSISTSSSTVTVTNSVISWTPTAGDGNLQYDPKFTNAPLSNTAPFTVADYTLLSTSPAINIGNNTYTPSGITTDLAGNPRTYNTTTDAGAYEYQGNPFISFTAVPSGAGILYVKKGATGNGSSWANALGEAAYAFKAAKELSAGSVQQIWIAGGTYYPMFRATDLAGSNDPSNPDNAFVLVNNVKVYGGFAGAETTLTQRDLTLTANKSTLSGFFTNNGGTGRAYHVVVGAGAVGTACVNGFTITGGNGSSGVSVTINSQSVNRLDGSGICLVAAAPEMDKLEIINNTNLSNGGGIYISGVTAKITNSTLSNNRAGYGGAVFCASATLTLENIIVQGNQANTGAGFCTNAATMNITNALITGNYASNNGGGISTNSGSSGNNVTITNATFSGNRDNYGAALFYNPSGNIMTIRNSIFWNNSSTFSGSSGFSITYTTSGYPGSTNSDGDPLFVNAPSYLSAPFTGGDYNLQTGSPAINAGNTALYNTGSSPDLSAITTDLAGNPRVNNTTVDRGAYEFQYDCATLPAAPVASAQNRYQGDTVAQLVATGSYLQWYTQPTGGTALSTTTPVTPQTYYVSQTINGCESPRTAVAVTVSLSPNAPAAGTVLYVVKGAAGNGSSWGNALGEVADALKNAKTVNEAVPGTIQQIWVAAGTYKPLYTPDTFAGPANNINNTFLLLKDVALYGNFAGTETILAQRVLPTDGNYTSILSGDFNNNDVLNTDGQLTSGYAENAGHVVVAYGTSSSPLTVTTVLDGFIIQGGTGYDNSTTINSGYGGGIYNRYASPQLTNITIRQNTATNGGGGMYNNFSSPYINNVLVQANRAHNAGSVGITFGAGIYNTSGSSPYITNTTFRKNLTYCSYSSGLSVGQAFGGGMYSDAQCAPTLIDVTFEQNTAQGEGIGYDEWTGQPSTYGNGSGGGLYQGGSYTPAVIENVTFTQNTAVGQTTTATTTSYGGGAYFNFTLPTPAVSALTFTGNNAAQGGGLFVAGFYEATIKESVFNGNTATSSGGGIYANYTSGSAALSFENLVIQNNTALANGGGIYNTYSGSAFKNSIIKNNTAGSAGSTAIRTGGGIYNSGNASYTNVVLTGNTAIASANARGGAIMNTGSAVFTNVTITGNAATGSTSMGGAVYNMGTAPLFRNTIIYGNTALTGPSVYKQTGTPQYAYSLIEGSAAGWDTFGTDSGNNIDVNPQFTDAATGNFTLMGTSPAINAGNNTYFNAGQTPNLSGITTDVAGNERIQDSTIDMGAYENTAAPCETPLPVAENQLYCNGDTVASLEATGENIKWYASQAATTPLSVSTALGTGIYYVTQTLNGCESGKLAITVTTTPGPAADAQAFCAGATVSMLTAQGTDLHWYSDADAQNLLSGSALLASGTYYVTDTVDGCQSLTTPVQVTITPVVSPVVNITASPQGTIALGDSVTFTAVIQNGGTAPVYTWKKNGTTVGDNSSTYTSNTLVNNDVITVEVTGNAGCTTTEAVESNAITMNVVIVPTPSATGILYVSQNGTGNGSSWDSPLAQLADALKTAATNTAVQQIWVSSGTYKPMYRPDDLTTGTVGDRNRTFRLVNNVKVCGGFAGGETSIDERPYLPAANTALGTTLSGDFNSNDVLNANGEATSGNGENAFHVVLSADSVGTAVLDGFTITGGKGASSSSQTVTVALPNVAVYSLYGGGIYVAKSSPQLSHLLITGNRSTLGGGIYITGTSSATANMASPKIINTTLKYNTASIESFSGGAPLGGGTMNASYSSATYTNVLISNNTCLEYGGGGVGTAGYNVYPYFTNATITANIGVFGGGVANQENYTGATTFPKFRNSIIYGNTSTSSGLDENIQNSSYYNPEYYYCIVENSGSTNWNSNYGYNMGNNIGTNPLLSATDYTLQAGSPAYNAGNSAYFNTGQTPNLSAITTDLAGNARIQGSAIDIGAYEYVACTPPAAPVASAQEHCGDVTFAELEAEGQNLQWYEFEGAAPFAGTDQVPWGSIYYVTQTVNGCESGYTAVEITLKAGPIVITDYNPVVCGSYVIPPSTTGSDIITSGYYTGTGGTGDFLPEGSAITTSQTIYAYATNECGATEAAVNVTVHPDITVDEPENVSSCNGYVLPALTNGYYMDHNPGDVISENKTIYITNSGYCGYAESSFTVTIESTTPAPVASAQTACFYSTVADLDATGENIQWYRYEDDTIPMYASSTVWGGTYYVTQTIGGCESPRTAVEVTMIDSPQLDPVTDVYPCGGYELPYLSVGNYYTGPNGTGQMIAAGTYITTAQYMYVYAVNECGATEQSFYISIHPVTEVDYLNDVTECNFYYLPELTNGSYQGHSEGDAISETETIYIYNNGYCGYAESSFTVTIESSTPAPAAAPQTFCNNAMVQNLVATGTDLNWYGTETAEYPLSVYDEIVTGTYYVTQTVDGCESRRTAVAVTVLTPIAPSVYIDAPSYYGNLCTADTVTFQAYVTNAGASPSYQWYVNGALQAGQTASSFSYYATQSVTVHCAVTITDTNGCYTDTYVQSDEYYITVINATAAIVANGPTSFCQGGSVVLEGYGTGYHDNGIWYRDGEYFDSYYEEYHTIEVTATGTYTLELYTEDGCYVVADAVYVESTTTAVPTATAQDFCNGATVANLTATGNNLQWYAGATGGSPLAATHTLASGIYYVSQTVNGCESDRIAVYAFVHTTPAPEAVATQTFCESGTVANLTATGDNLQWYATASGGSALASSVVITNGTYFVSQTVNGCEGERAAVTVSIATPLLAEVTIVSYDNYTGPDGQPQSCIANTLNFEAFVTNAGDNAMLQWLVNGAEQPGENNAVFSYTPSGAGMVNIQCRVTVGSDVLCPVAPVVTSADFEIEILNAPYVAIIPLGNTAFCEGGNVSLQADGIENYEGIWLKDGEFYDYALSGYNETITVTQAGTYTLEVTGYNGCSAVSGPVTVSVSYPVTPAVTLSVSPTGSIMAGTPVTFTASPVNGGTSPVYTFKVNGTTMQSGASATYTTTTLTNNAAVYVQMMSNAACASIAEVYSNTIVMSVTPQPSTVITPDAAGILYVRKGQTGNGSSWGSALGEVADALKAAKQLNDATAGTVTQVWVAGGTYHPAYLPTTLEASTPADRNKAFLLVKDVKVYGGFAGYETALAQRNLALTTNTSVLSGDLEGNDLTGSNAENCHHIVLAIGTSASPLTTATVLDGFTISGGNANASGTLAVNGQNINRSFGGGIYNQNASPAYTNLIIKDNRANQSGGGMYSVSNSSSVLTNTAIVQNTAVNGGGMYNVSASNTILTNVTIAGNTASTNGGGIYTISTSVKVRNTVIQQNTSGVYTLGSGAASTPEYSYSHVQGLTATTNGNINGSVSAQFTNPATSMYTLTVTSPLVNTGSNSFYNTGLTPNLSGITTDIAGLSRFINGTADIGAYELTSECAITTTWNGTAWSNGVPNSYDYQAVIAGNYSSEANIRACSLTVTGGTVTVNAGHTFTIKGTVTVDDANATLTFKDNAALVQEDDVENNGTITLHKNSNPLYRLDYTMWSSPVEDWSLYNFSPATASNRFYEYTQVNGLDVYSAVASSTVFAKAKGFLIRMPNAVSNNVTGTTNDSITTPAEYIAGTDDYIFNGTFTGTPHNGSVQYPLNMQGGRYTAVGNPYPSPINLWDFFLGDTDAVTAGTQANSNAIDITSGIYLWRKRNNTVSSSYATLSLAGYVANPAPGGGQEMGDFFTGNASGFTIAPGQGFIVRAKEDAVNPQLKFTNSMRREASGAGHAFFRSAASTASRLWLNLTAENNMASQAMVGYFENGTLGLDYGFDAKKLTDGNTVAIYSLAENTPLAIQARPGFETTDVVPMGFTLPAAGTFTITLDHTDGIFTQGQKIYLRDNEQGIIHNMENAYTFIAEAGTHEGRFDVIYTIQSLSTENPALVANTVIVYTDGTTIGINSGNAMMNMVTIYDIRGRRLFRMETVNDTKAIITNLTAEQQVLIVEVETVKGKVSKRIIF